MEKKSALLFFFSLSKSSVYSRASVNVTFDIGLLVGGGRKYIHKYVRTNARTDDGHVITKISRIYRLPFFLTHSAPLRRRKSALLQTFDVLKC